MRVPQTWQSAALTAALGLAAVLVACQTPSEPALPATPLPPPAAQLVESAGDSAAMGEFSADRAWGHLTSLAEMAPRVTGTEGAERARDYIVGHLEELGIEILPEDTADESGEDGVTPRSLSGIPDDVEPKNILAEIPGASDDLIVLVAPYDSRHFDSFAFKGVNDGASGAALLLDLATVLQSESLPYTTWLLFTDAEAPVGEGPHTTMKTQLFGSRLQAARFRLDGVLPRIRLIAAFNQVCDADLSISRDLQSHRLYREDFWAAAERLGHTDAFGNERGFETPGGAHLSFFLMGARRVVFIGDLVFGGDESPGIYADTEDDDLEHCSPNSLGVVGSVSADALGAIGSRLAKIDRFSTSPLAKLESEKEDAPDTSTEPLEALDAIPPAPVPPPETASDETP